MTQGWLNLPCAVSKQIMCHWLDQGGTRTSLVGQSWPYLVKKVNHVINECTIACILWPSGSCLLMMEIRRSSGATRISKVGEGRGWGGRNSQSDKQTRSSLRNEAGARAPPSKSHSDGVSNLGVSTPLPPLCRSYMLRGYHRCRYAFRLFMSKFSLLTNWPIEKALHEIG